MRSFPFALVAAALAAPLAAQTPFHFLVGEMEESTGAAIAGVGDLDGDGCDDVAIGAPSWSDSTPGRVLVIGGRDGSLLLELTGRHKGSRFGQSLAAMGDVDHDGVPDLAVGAIKERVGGAESGVVRLFSGRDGRELRRFAGRASSGFGFSLACAGDVDGDGTPDLVVGAPYDDTVDWWAGAVRVYSGATGALLHELPGSVGIQLGRNVAGGADLDGDGRGDFLAGDMNRVRAVSGATGATLYELSADHKCGFGAGTTGRSIALVADQDGDGRQDVLVGATCDYSFGTNFGAAYLYSGAGGTLLRSIAGPYPDSYFGESVDGAGDVDGDGLEDLLVGSFDPGNPTSKPGVVWIHSSATGELLVRVRGAQPASWYGWIAANVGDVNGDGRTDIAVGAPAYEPVKWQPERGAASIVLLGAVTVGEDFCQPAHSNSIQARGRLVALGSDSVNDKDLELVAVELPPDAACVLLVSRLAGFVAGPGGSYGDLCLGGQVGRFRPGASSASGTVRVRVDLDDLPIAGGIGVVAGQTWLFQGWYVDGSGSNLTQAVRVRFR